MKIIKTISYAKFHLLPMNREIMSNHATKMAESIEAMGVIRPVVCCQTNEIDGINKLWVLDGQHLLTGLQRLEMEVPYTVIPVTNELDIVKKMGMLNSSSKSWSLMNYVNAYKMLLPDYMQLFKLKNLYDIEVAMLAAICGLNSSYDAGGGSRIIKEGGFKVINNDTAKMCKNLSGLFLAMPGIEHTLKRKFLRAMLNSGSSYNHAVALVNIQAHITQLTLMSTEHNVIEYIQKNIFKVQPKKTK